MDVPVNSELANLIRATAGNIGIDPVDLGTTMSYETGGTFDPQVRGPVTKWGQHIGLIQMGDAQRKRYGITPDSPLPQQFEAIEKYLRDAGVRRGHGLLDIYSAINAGGVGQYGRSDAHAGGAPGTVADKVASMAAHRARAEMLLNGKLPAALSSGSTSRPAASPPAAAPLSLAPPEAPAGDEDFARLVLAAQQIAAATRDEDDRPRIRPALPPLQVGPLRMRA